MATPEARTELGERVRRRRERLGMTIDEAAEQGGISPVTWSRVELARAVRRLTYSTVDRVLGWREGASLDFLDEGFEPAPPEEARPIGRVKRKPIGTAYEVNEARPITGQASATLPALEARATGEAQSPDPLESLPEDPEERRAALVEMLDQRAKETAEITAELSRLMRESG